MREWISEHQARLIALTAVTSLFAIPFLALLWMTAVPGKSFAGPLPPLTASQVDLASRLRGHVEAIARAPHNPSHPEALESAAQHIEASLAASGYKVERQPFDGGKVRNIAATLQPVDPQAETLVIGAHYDSAFDSPGANDNASGTAAVLELARLLADLRGKAPLRLRFVLFVNEEPPFFQTERMGSRVYAERLRASGERVRGMWSLETLGYYSDRPGSQRYPFPFNMLYPDTGSFVAFVGTTGSRGFVRETVAAFRARVAFPSVGGTAPGFVQGISWSDHWAFEQAGFPALMITDTAPFRYPHYHSKQDTPDKLDYARLARVVIGLEAVICAPETGVRP